MARHREKSLLRTTARERLSTCGLTSKMGLVTLLLVATLTAAGPSLGAKSDLRSALPLSVTRTHRSYVTTAAAPKPRSAGAPDLAESFAVALIAGLVAALAIFVTRALRDWWTYRRGQLTGYWLWLTYDPSATDKLGPLWSVEIAELKHRHTAKADRIDGTMWRVFDREAPSHWTRSWTLTGWKVDEVVEGVYKWKRDSNGSHGVIHLWTTDDGFEGTYIRVVRSMNGGSLTHDSVTAMTELAELPKELPPALESVIERIPEEIAREYPRRVRRKLGIGRSKLLTGLLESMAYSAAPADNYFPLVLAGEKRRARETRRAQEKGPLVIHRRDLKLGTQNVIPGPSSGGDGGARIESFPDDTDDCAA